jgi:hypothetical protein
MDVVKWLREDMKFSDEDAKALAPKFEADGRADALEKGFARQADYSRAMDKLKTEQEKLGEANERLTAEMAEWAATQARGETLTKKQKESLDAAEASVLKLTQTVRSLATAAGQDPEEILKGAAVVVPPKKDDDPPAPDMSGYLTREHGAQLAQLSLTIPAEIAALAHEHLTLTGEHLDARALAREVLSRLNTKGNQKSTDVRVVWEEMYDVPSKRTAADKKKFDDAIAAAEKRGREAALSEAPLPGQPTAPGAKAPVFQHLGGPERTSKLERPQPGQGISTAAAALRSHKYAQPSGAGAPAKT